MLVNSLILYGNTNPPPAINVQISSFGVKEKILCWYKKLSSIN